MRKTVVMLWLIFSSLHAGTVHIALAANMSEAIKPLVARFEQQHPQSRVEYTIGGSGKLAAQIANGAPFDLFLSANMAYPQRLYQEGHTVTEPVVYAQGALVLLSVKPRDMQEGLKILRSEKIDRIAIANPKTAPYGVAAVEALKYVGLYDALLPKFVYGESISQTLTYTLRAVDIGIVAKSALFGPNMKQFKEGINWVDVPKESYTPIAQGMVLLKRAEDNRDAGSFFSYMQSAEAKKILAQYGYRLP
ncbi:MAG: molybdate ABC transporter substrate-binding protein [Sulfurovum sp.]|nr:molybdate ABC transporter substrate-binding protein [Sulfurovum sp.]